MKFVVVASLAVSGCFDLPHDYSSVFRCEDGICGDGYRCIEKQCIREDRRVFYVEEQPEPLANFPVLVTVPIMKPGGNYEYAKSIRFFSSENKVLAHELDYIGTHIVTAWVLVPHVKGRESGQDIDEQTFIQSAQDSRTEPDDPWNERYISVFHFADETFFAKPAFAATPGVRDSSGQGRDGIVTGESGPFRGTAARRASRWFQRGAIEIAAPPLVTYTISGWFHPSTNDTSAMASRPGAFWVGNSGGYYAVRITTERGAARVEHELRGEPVQLGAWVHLAITVTRTRVTLYVNGEHVACGHYDKIAQSDAPIYVGAHRRPEAPVPDADYLNGAVDELRIETVARPDVWIRAEALSQNAEMAIPGRTTAAL